MSSTIYNMAHPPQQHRTLQPSGPPAPRPRLDDSLDAIRQDFDLMTQELNAMRSQRDEYEAKIASQVNELNIIRQSLYDLESQHGKIRQHYEEEIARARAEGRSTLPQGIASLGGPSNPGPSAAAGPSGPGGPIGPGGATPVGPGGPGVVGPGQGMGMGPGGGQGAAGGVPAGMGAPGLQGAGAPAGLYGDPYYSRERDPRDRDRERDMRDRDRDRDRERERDRDPRGERERERDIRMDPRDRDVVMRDPRDRERDRDRMGGPVGPAGMMSERELRERERDRLGSGMNPHDRTPLDARDRDRALLESRGGGGPDRDRDGRDRLTDSRDTKRLKADRMKSDRPDHFSPSLPHSSGPTPKLPPPPSSTGPGGAPPPGGSGYPSSATVVGPGSIEGNSLGLIPISSASGPGAAGPSSTPLQQAHSLLPGQPSFPDDIDIHAVSPDMKKEGSDWFAIFNPKVKRVLDVSLVHTLMHESVVCCVRFSADGKYLATGCNRTAQIYDTKTGQKTCVLADDSAGKSGDLYIRSVCFSPDGKYLATGAEDKQIRIWDIAKKRIRNVFDGHQQEIYSLDFSLDGRVIVSGSGDKTARIWDMIDGTSKVLTINDPDSLNNDAGVTSVAISPDGRWVAAGSLDTVVRIWDVQTAVLVERLRGHRDSVYSVAFTPDGKGLVSGSLDKTLKYWDVSGLGGANGVKGRKEGQNGGAVSGPGGPSGARKDDKGSQCTMNFTGHKDYVLSVAVSHDGAWVVSGSKDRGVQFWDARTALVQCMLQGHKNSVISIDLSPAGNVLATGSGDWQARIWSYTTTM